MPAHPLRLSFAWWLVMLGLSASLSLNYVSPLLDTRASQYSPFHTHLLLGGTAASRAWLLAHHPHQLSAVASAVGADPVARSASANQLINAASSLSDLLHLSTIGAVLAAFAWPLVLAPLAVWVLLFPPRLARLGLRLSPPDRPPRPA
jgi:hypothetical protein